MGAVQPDKPVSRDSKTVSEGSRGAWIESPGIARGAVAGARWTFTAASAGAAGSFSGARITNSEKKRRATHADPVTAVRKLIASDGRFCYKVSGGPQGCGVPSNLICVRRERPVAIEVKVGRDRLADDQEKFLRRWCEADGIGIEGRDAKAVADALGIPMLL